MDFCYSEQFCHFGQDSLSIMVVTVVVLFNKYLNGSTILKHIELFFFYQ